MNQLQLGLLNAKFGGSFYQLNSRISCYSQEYTLIITKEARTVIPLTHITDAKASATSMTSTAFGLRSAMHTLFYINSQCKQASYLVMIML